MPVIGLAKKDLFNRLVTRDGRVFECSAVSSLKFCLYIHEILFRTA